ncbi:unnamed protein product [Symbiodinium sp. CCMP2592]|nr:unnamed protein product [Symbiodinium sp. CCMP2592]
MQVIPNEDHPSDHFPVFVTFTLKDSYEKHRDCARRHNVSSSLSFELFSFLPFHPAPSILRAWLECVAGREKAGMYMLEPQQPQSTDGAQVHPLTDEELRDAFERDPKNQVPSAQQSSMIQTAESMQRVPVHCDGCQHCEQDQEMTSETVSLLLQSSCHFLQTRFFDRDRQECIHRRDLEEACSGLDGTGHTCGKRVWTFAVTSAWMLGARTVQHLQTLQLAPILSEVPKLLVDCFPNKISFQNFLRAYEASLGSDRMRAVGDLECAFRYFAGEKDSIEIDTLEAAFREITPISFSDDEVKDMIGRVAQDGSPYGKASVHLKDFCEVSPESGVTGTESETWAARNATKEGKRAWQVFQFLGFEGFLAASGVQSAQLQEISTRLTKLHKTVSGQGHRA